MARARITERTSAGVTKQQMIARRAGGGIRMSLVKGPQGKVPAPAPRKEGPYCHEMCLAEFGPGGKGSQYSWCMAKCHEMTRKRPQAPGGITIQEMIARRIRRR